MAGDKRKKRSSEYDANSTQQIRLSLQKKIKEVLGRVGKGAERRGGDDRRGWHPMPRPPFLDSSGQLVTRDRRSSPERRVSNIEVEYRGRHQKADDGNVED